MLIAIDTTTIIICIIWVLVFYGLGKTIYKAIRHRKGKKVNGNISTDI